MAIKATVMSLISVILLWAAFICQNKINEEHYLSEKRDRIDCLKDQNRMYKTVKVVTDVQIKNILQVLLEVGTLESKVERLEKGVAKLKRQVKKYRKLLKINHG